MINCWFVLPLTEACSVVLKQFFTVLSSSSVNNSDIVRQTGFSKKEVMVSLMPMHIHVSFPILSFANFNLRRKP